MTTTAKPRRLSIASVSRRVGDLLSAALAGGLILAVIGQLSRPSFQTVGLLFNLPLPVVLACMAQLLLAVTLLISPRRLRPWPLRAAAAVILTAFLVIAVLDMIQYYRLWSAGMIEPRRAMPLSFYELLVLSLRLVTVNWPAASDIRPRPVMIGLAAIAGGFCLPLAEQLFFGSTEYCQNANVAVVLGAGIHPDGTPTDALQDRVNTAVRLYKDQRVRALLMTGGVDNAGSEPQVMRRLAIEAGVPADVTVLDERGSNTQASARNLIALMHQFGWHDCLLVSHDFHLPRIKRLLDREGVRSYTVPAHEARPLLMMGPWYRLREVFAWHYYLLGLPGRSGGE